MTIAVVPKIVKGRVLGGFRFVRAPLRANASLDAGAVDQLNIARGVLVGFGFSLALWAVILHSVI